MSYYDPSTEYVRWIYNYIVVLDVGATEPRAACRSIGHSAPVPQGACMPVARDPPEKIRGLLSHSPEMANMVPMPTSHRANGPNKTGRSSRQKCRSFDRRSRRAGRRGSRAHRTHRQRHPQPRRSSPPASSYFTAPQTPLSSTSSRPLTKQLTDFCSIVFVHGLTGDREKTWMAAGASEPWPKALLPSKIPTARVLTFGYDAYVADWSGVVSENRITDHAWNLLTSLATYRDDDDTVGASSPTR